MILSALMVALIALSIAQRDRTRFAAAFCFSAAIVVHDAVFRNSDGSVYFLSAAAVDLLVMSALSRISEPCKVVSGLQRVCLLSTIINTVGWVAWYAFVPSAWYGTAFIALYAYAATILLDGTRDNVGRFGGNRDGTGLRVDNHTCGIVLLGNSGASEK